MFFHFYKNINKTWTKTSITLSIQVRSTFKHRQYESNKVNNLILLQNTRSVQEMESLPMRNASYLKFCTFLFQKNNKNTTLKTQKNIKNINKH